MALILRPIPNGAVVLLGLVAAVATRAMPIESAVAGYADPAVWLMLAAFMISRAFVKTGLAKRIALALIQRLGRTTLGLAYALVASDVMPASMIPAVTARVGGVMLPITRSLAELYDSHPGPTAPHLGRYLMLALYQGGIVACAMFLTGQAGNPLAADLHEAGLTGTFADAIGGVLGGWTWAPMLAVMALVFFYSHYVFASITTHLVSMFPAFAAVLIAAGAPPAMTVVCLASFANLSAGLTHFGSAPAPIIFGAGYVEQRVWWRAGLILSLVNLGVWFTLGAAWWRLIGLW